ncbi:carbohydrate ABC transporter permease [Paenibacillus beijingensis]|uniref:ABC transporter permease n=1 Tax=Paenibacillus beijingensis TaxID=1126833 RepID=A0A0D5NQD9_9BACL|nr:sugar ABC transporter permease [Paenibacillus beijingensis]AJY77390.1 ABC transporter permease [Paenibacillus beijingensis]
MYAFISPWLIGFIVFALFPIAASLYYSFTDYDIIHSPKWVGLENYKTMFVDDLFWKSVTVTLQYTFISVPLQLLLALGFALLLNQKIPFQGFFRTAMYFPSMVSGVAMSLLWYWVFNPQIGLFNYMLSWVGIKGPAWLMDPRTALYSLIIMSFWTVGGAMILFLAGLQGVPSSLVEAAKLDGAGRLSIFLHVTLPMISPVLLFQLIMGIIDSFQVFTQAFVMTQGGPNYSTWFYVYNIYTSAFKEYRAGYSSALSWLLLFVVLFVTFIIMKMSNRYVHYEGGKS